jgi:excisionase family DNA binding protein
VASWARVTALSLPGAAVVCFARWWPTGLPCIARSFRLLGIPRSSVYEYARRGEDPLPAVRVGRHVRFHRTTIERWLAAQHG